MQKRELKPGDVVQITDRRSYAYGAMMMVTEQKSWGATGVLFAHIDMALNRLVSNGLAYTRCQWEWMEFVGVIVINPDVAPAPDPKTPTADPDPSGGSSGPQPQPATRSTRTPSAQPPLPHRPPQPRPSKPRP